MPFPCRADFMLLLTFISFFFQKETKLFFFMCLQSTLKGKEGVNHCNPFALFLLTGLCNSLWALAMPENSVSIQSRDVYMQTSSLTSESDRKVSWCCLWICNGRLAACYVDLLGQKTEKKAGFSQRKGALGLPLPLKRMCSTSSSDILSLLLLKMQTRCYKQEKVFGFLSVRHCCA